MASSPPTARTLEKEKKPSYVPKERRRGLQHISCVRAEQDGRVSTVRIALPIVCRGAAVPRRVDDVFPTKLAHDEEEFHRAEFFFVDSLQGWLGRYEKHEELEKHESRHEKHEKHEKPELLGGAGEGEDDNTERQRERLPTSAAMFVLVADFEPAHFDAATYHALWGAQKAPVAASALTTMPSPSPE